MAVERLKMTSNADAWISRGSSFKYLCSGGVREVFDIPEDTQDIVFCVSDRKVRGAIEARKVSESRIDFAIEFADGTITQILQDDFAEWLPVGPFWFWIEY